VVSRHDYLPFGEEIPPTIGARTALADYASLDPVRHRFAGKERDRESGLDYFGARYYAGAQGRFTGADPENAGSRLLEPQSWNGYSYTLNNPLRYVDPDGEAAETLWDAANVAMGVASLVSNVKAGNAGAAVLDAVGVVVDSAAAAVPFVPGGAGAIIKGVRAVDKAADAVQAADKVADAGKLAGNMMDAANATGDVASSAKVARGGESAAARGGRAAHREFAEKVKAKGADGWKSEPRIVGPDGKVLKPDALSPSGRPVELKPNTSSGRRTGGRQLKKYEAATGQKGRVVYYDP